MNLIACGCQTVYCSLQCRVIASSDSLLIFVGVGIGQYERAFRGCTKNVTVNLKSNTFCHVFLQDLATHTRITPEQRVMAIRKFCENVRNCPEACLELEKWGLKIDQETINTRGRHLGRELILMGQNRSQNAGDRADFTRFVTTSPVITPVCIDSEHVLYLNF